MRLRIAVTDNDWFRFLRSHPDVDEVDFWKPGGIQKFYGLNPGELLLQLNQVLQATEAPKAMFGNPVLMRPRLGQGTFRVLVTDNYNRRCAVTGEKALPALDAAHIRPVDQGGQHQIDNGLLLRMSIASMTRGM